jgi:hypothetical protein
MKGNLYVSSSKTTTNMTTMSLVILCISHNLSGHHLHHEWQRLPAILPTDFINQYRNLHPDFLLHFWKKKQGSVMMLSSI